MNNKIVIWTALILVILGGAFYAVDRSAAPTILPETTEAEGESEVDIVEEDEVEEVDSEPSTSGGSTQAGCYVGGCSSQICSDDPGMVSTCEFQEEYACYRTAKCERQSSGQCGWTDTPELKMCLGEASR